MKSVMLLSYFLWQLQAPAFPVTHEVSPARPGALHVVVTEYTTESIPSNAQHVHVLTLDMTAPCDTADVQIHSIALRRTGPGYSSDVAAVYAEINDIRVSNAATVSRNGAIRLSLRNADVPSCDSRTVNIFVDMAPDAFAGAVHRFALTADPIESSAASTDVSQREAVPAALQTAGYRQGSVRVEYPAVRTAARYGDNRLIGRLRLTARDRDQDIVSLQITNRGSASDNDVQNIYLSQSNGLRRTEIAPRLTDDTVRLVFDPPLRINRNNNVLLQIRADVRVGSSRTMQWYVEEPGDLVSRPVGRSGTQRE